MSAVVPNRPRAVSDAPGGDAFILRCSIEICSCLCSIGRIIGATVPEPVGWRTLLLVSSAEAAPVGGLSGLKPADGAASNTSKGPLSLLPLRALLPLPPALLQLLPPPLRLLSPLLWWLLSPQSSSQPRSRRPTAILLKKHQGLQWVDLGAGVSQIVVCADVREHATALRSQR